MNSLLKMDETNIYNPFNPINKEITLNDIQCILSKFGIPPIVHNIELYKRAFIHKSYTKQPNKLNEQENIVIIEQPSNTYPLKTKSNERLEFLGDGVLELITKYYLYKRFPKADEGFMTEKKIALVKNEHIGKLTCDLQLQQWFIISKHAEDKNIRNNVKKLGCLFEAFIGAIFLDFNKIQIFDEDEWFQHIFHCGPGFQMAQIFISNVFEKHVNWLKIIHIADNFKNILQVKIQKLFKITPDYLEMKHNTENEYKMGVFLTLGNKSIHHYQIEEAIPFQQFGSLHSIYHSSLSHSNLFILLSVGIHKIKKKAEQIACENVLQLCND